MFGSNHTAPFNISDDINRIQCSHSGQRRRGPWAGVLLETTARLLPGWKTTVVIINDADQSVRARGHVIRSVLVAIGNAGERIYQTAVAFREQLPPETRRALQGEREGITNGALSAPQLELGTLMEPEDQDEHVLIEWRAPAGAIHASGW